MQNHKRLCTRALILLVLLYNLAGGPAALPALATGASAGRTILVGGDDSYPPYEFLDQNRRPAGFNVDVMRAVAEAMGLDVAIRLGPWNQVRRDLEQGRIDAISGMYYSAQRDRLVDFSAPHILVSYAVFVRQGSKITALGQARGKRIIVQRGDIADDYLIREKLTPHVIRAANPAQALELLASGNDDCALLPRLQGLYLARKLGLESIQAVGLPLLTRKYCIAVAEGENVLLAQINEGLVIIRNSGEYDRIYEKWFGVHDRKAAVLKVLRYLVWVLVPMLLLLVLAFIWTWSLKRTVRRRTRALQESEEKYRLLVENANDAIYILQDRVFKFVNKNGLELSGYTAAEITGLPFTQLLHPDDRQLVQLRYQRRLAGEKVESNYPVRLVTRDGRELWLQVNQVRITWQGRPATLNIARDITEQRLMEERLRQSQKMEAVGTLAGGVAHDFNNILGAIIGYSELAQDSAEMGRDCSPELNRVIESAERARNLLKQILTFSRKLESDLKPLDLNQEVRRSVEVLERTLPKMVDIDTDLAVEPWQVKADATQMEQMIINLAANAADAMPQGGQMRIQTRNHGPDDDYGGLPEELKPGQWVRLTVSDNGSGMDQETLDQIFDPFFTTKAPGKGTGLGLSTVFGIVRSHGGHIFCQSRPEQGTTFEVYLPAAAAEPRPDLSPPAATPKAVARGGETILLVDDESYLRSMGEKMLARSGYQVRLAENGEQALELYAAGPDAYDLVVLDLNMPGMGGLRCLEELIRLDPGVRVLVASGYASQGMGSECLEAGAAGFISKPFRRRELLEAIRKVLDHSGGVWRAGVGAE